MEVRDGRKDDVLALMQEMVASTEANEPGTLNYEWSFSDDGTICHLYERYVDSESAMIHGRTFDARFADRFLALLNVNRFVFYGTPSPEVVAGAGPFNPIVMRLADGVTR